MKKETLFVTKSYLPPFDEFVEAIKPLWDSRWITNMGKYHQEFENKLKEYLGVKEVSLMVNGHMALEMTIQAFCFPAGSEVITVPFTFISTTHAIVRNGLTPIFCDVKSDNGTIDEAKIEELITDKTVAIVPVHVYGNICNVDIIQQIADKYGLKVIYDAAHAFGRKHNGIGIGNYGDASVFSFHATKVFNSIEGGAVTFSDHSLYDKLFNLKNFGIRGEETVESVGANAKMNEFCAVMGLCNLNHISESIKKRQLIVNNYILKLKGIKGIRPLLDRGGVDSYSYFPIIIEKEYGISRDELNDIFRSNDIKTRKYFYPLTSDQDCYKGSFANHNLCAAKMLSDNVLTLPLFEEMDSEDINIVITVLRQNAKGASN